MRSRLSDKTGAAIRRLRLARGWSLAQLGEASGVPVSTLSRVELGQNALNYDKLIRLCRALNYSGWRVHADSGLHTISGKDGYHYGYRVSEFRRYMEHHFGPPKGVGSSRGIICFELPGHAGYTGHFDLWDGVQCRHEGYFNVASAVHIWPC